MITFHTLLGSSGGRLLFLIVSVSSLGASLESAIDIFPRFIDAIHLVSPIDPEE